MWQCSECRPLQCPHWLDCSKCWGWQWWSCHPRFRYCSPNLSQFLFHCPKHSRTKKVKECKPHFHLSEWLPKQNRFEKVLKWLQHTESCVWLFSSCPFLLLFPPPLCFSFKSFPFNCLSCSICLPLVLSIFWEEVVGGVERGIKREVQDRIKGWRMEGSLIEITC